MGQSDRSQQRVGVVLVGCRELELCLEGGDGSPQVMRCRGDEPALAPNGLSNTVKHGVQGAAEATELVVRGRDIQPAKEVPGLDGVHLANHHADRVKGSARKPPAAPQGRERGDQPGHEHQPGEVGEARIDLREGSAGDDRGAIWSGDRLDRVSHLGAAPT